MATTGPAKPQRAWRAACPQCGAPVEFASAASPVAVCSFCRSTLARDGEALRRIGQSAELFDDHSPLQRDAQGRFEGQAFHLVGRLQLQYAEGRWTEWAILFDDGRRGWLSEDNGRYVLGFDAPLTEPPPLADALPLGGTVPLAGQRWQVSAITTARVAAAEGELPSPPPTGEYTLVELRSPTGEVGTLDYGNPAQPAWSVGQSVELDGLQLQGLREAEDKALKARAAECPNCGTALNIQLDSTQSIVCHQCQAVVDVSQGVGGDLSHYVQSGASAQAAEPLLPLGATATLALGSAPKPWQVVGYAERCEVPDDPEDERVFWREYLLYNREVGFAFLVDAEDGWSWTVPITGAPQVKGDTAQWKGTRYQKRFDYGALTTHVLGEFYWKVEREQRSRNTDYAAGNKQLSREQTGQEITWSAGAAIPAETIAQAFGLKGAKSEALARDASPLATGSGTNTRSWLVTAVVIFALLFLLVAIMASCSRNECDALRETFGADSDAYRQCTRSSSSGVSTVPRTSGGSFGGGSSGGGGHK